MFKYFKLLKLLTKNDFASIMQKCHYKIEDKKNASELEDF